jgi:hypothetical protein
MKSKTEHAAYMREWMSRNGNRERVNEQTRARRAANFEAVKAKRKAWEAVRSDASKQNEADYKKAWAAANREKVRAASTAYNKRVGRYWLHIKHKFGISRAAWEEMFEAQGRCCAVCGISAPETQRFFTVDHCHETGDIRGILCVHCNAMLGQAKDSIDILLSGVEYLKNSR